MSSVTSYISCHWIWDLSESILFVISESKIKAFLTNIVNQITDKINKKFNGNKFPINDIIKNKLNTPVIFVIELILFVFIFSICFI